VSAQAASAAKPDKHIGGYAFKHELNDQHEVYYHIAPRNRWEWGIYRHRYATGAMGMEWTAYVAQPGPTTPCMVLNHALYKMGGKEIDHHGPLYKLNACDPDLLLAGVAGLINVGAWPENIKPDGGQRR
jgi:hypothetical protein